MGTRTKIRKERREAERQEVKAEMRERYLQETARMRKTFTILGVALGTMVVVIGLVFGSIAIYKNMNPIVTGPFGTIKVSELEKNKFATLNTTQGDIKIELDAKDTPKTVANFVLLAQKNFFDGVKFHRVIKDFMIQTGDPNSKDDDLSNDGQGGPGYKFDDEKFTGEYARGTVAMANAGANTNGSQFFIVLKDTPSLPKNYVIFGHVTDGMDVVDAIGNTPVVKSSSDELSQPKTPIMVNKVVLSDK